MSDHPSNKLFSGEVHDPIEALDLVEAELIFEEQHLGATTPYAETLAYVRKVRAQLQAAISECVERYADNIPQGPWAGEIAEALRSGDYTSLAI